MKNLHPEAQRRLYEGILNNTPDLAYIFDLNHRFIYANDGLLKMWGKTWDEAIGRNCLELGYEPWHAAMHDREIEQVVATKQPIRGEVPFTGTFGTRIYDYLFVPVIGTNGEVEAVAGTTRDVTERKQLEASLQEADRRKDEFLATLAHELRNPLGPIRHAAQISKAPNATQAQIKWSQDVIDRQVEHMAHLLDDLLDVSRITRGKVELRQRRLLLKEALEAAVETARPLIETRGHLLSIDVPSGDIHIDADPVRLAQILSNLLTNAAKYTNPGGIIRIKAQTADDKATVSIQDNGIGIAPEQLPNLFEMFSQAASALERSEGGLGIGLALARGLVALHGGTLEARSAGLGMGSEFILTLPLAADEHAHKGQKELLQGKSPGA